MINSKYTTLLKSNFNKLFPVNEEGVIIECNTESRPGTAKSKQRPVKSIQRNFRSDSGEGNEKFMSFSGKPDSLQFKSIEEAQERKEATSSQSKTKKETANINNNLTQYVWPKSRTLLSIVSKMFSECHINVEQRGVLKDMILDHDKGLKNILNTYEITRDREWLYGSIIEAVKEKLRTK